MKSLDIEMGSDAPLRRATVVLHNAGGVFDSYKDKVNVPVQIRFGDANQSLFVGQTEMPEIEEGKAEWLTLSVPDLYRRLQRAILNSATIYDGMAHSAAVRDLLHRAGFSDAYLGFTGGDDFPLPSSTDEEPLFRPTDGQSVAEFLEYIRDAYSGWWMGFDTEGFFYYMPPYTDATAIVNFYSSTLDANNAGGAAAHAYPVYEMRKQVDDSLYKNEVWVVGVDPAAEPYIEAGESPPDNLMLWAWWKDWDSLNTPAHPYYVYGERRLLIWMDGSLTTQDSVNWVARTLRDEFMHFKIRRTWRSDFDLWGQPGVCVSIDGVPHRIISARANFESALRQCQYEAEEIVAP